MSTAAEATFNEATGSRKVSRVPLSQLSIELGHLYREDFELLKGDALADHFAWVKPWADTAKQRFGGSGRGRPRVSTCFLIDDYFAPFSSPDVVIPALCDAAAKAGLTIDYIAREAGCAVADGVELAGLAFDRLVPEPPEDTDGSRPPVTESGWLSNGERSGSGLSEAMGGGKLWTPPVENAARRHSVFVDIELWNFEAGQRIWSCPFLAAVWQLVRLGMLRHNGAPVAVPEALQVKGVNDWGDRPDVRRLEHVSDWSDLPSVVQVNPDASPFCAYRTHSVLPNRFRLVELAVQVILSQLAVDDAVLAQITQRSEAEGFSLPSEIVDRINYVFDEGVAGGP